MRIRVIKPKKVENKLLRVCAYARVSAASDELKESIAEQKRHYEHVITSNPAWEYAGIYADEGISGFLDNRPEFQRMMRDARNKRFDLILVKSISRFARNTETLINATRELTNLGIGVYFELQGINTLTIKGELLLTIKAAFAQGESDSGSQLMKMSCRNRFEKGIPMARTGKTYGYRKAPNGEIIIDERKAGTVRMIFKLAEQGVWRSKIADKLNEMQIASPEGRKWNDSQVARILTNVTYKGDLLLQKTFKDVNHKTRTNHGEATSWYIRTNHTPVIAPEQWERVQRVLEERKDELERSKKKCDMQAEKHPVRRCYPLTGLLFCPFCSAVLHHKWCNRGRDEYWVCSTNIKKKAASCKGIFVPAKVMVDWDIHEPVVVQKYKDTNGMVKFTCYPKDEFEMMKGEA